MINLPVLLLLFSIFSNFGIDGFEEPNENHLPSRLIFGTGGSFRFVHDFSDEVEKLREDQSCLPKAKIPSKQVYENLRKRIESIKISCGEICDTSLEGIPGKYYNVIKKAVDCKSLFTNPDIDAEGEFPNPPTKIPKYLVPEYTYNGKLKLAYRYLDDSCGVSHNLDWSMEVMNRLKKLYHENNLQGGYGQEAVERIKNHIDEFVQVKDKTVLVVGSQTPWLETILLEKGAKFITTLDYVKITSEHPQVEVLTPSEISKKFIDENLQFDVMITFSSIEHSGLGRYGDSLNPWGDLIAMARAWCLVRPGGKAIVGVPSGPDTVLFNSHRLYGPIAYSQIFSNWDQVFTTNNFALFNISGCDSCYQPLHVLQKPEEQN